MAVVAISDSILTDIADAIRSKNGQETLYKPSQMPDAIEAISGGGITPTGTKEITSNGTGIDVASYAYADVAVPNTYAAGDEGKVVSNGALVSQSSDSVTQNGTVDTTLINSLTVNVSGGGSSDITFHADEIKTIVFRKGEASEINVDFTKLSGISSLNSVFNGDTSSTAWTKITIKPPTSAKDTRNMFYCSTSAGNTTLTQVVIDGTLKCTHTGGATLFGNRKGLQTISGLIDMTGITRADAFSGTAVSTNLFANCNSLQSVGFVPGSMTLTTTNWTLQWCSALSDESLVSIANALKDTYSGTLTLHSTPKARLSTIMGTVATDDGLSIFTKDVSGTVTLENFLTVTKGATIA